MSVEMIEFGRDGKILTLAARTWLSGGRAEVFSFFADAGNLDALTPPRLKFHITSPRPIVMRVGALINYRLRIHGMPLRWQSEITAWEPPLRFVDEQRRGPYQQWTHEHLFGERAGGTTVWDKVSYAVPGGRWVNRLFVRRDLNAIFHYRRQCLQDIFRPSRGLRDEFAIARESLRSGVAN